MHLEQMELEVHIKQKLFSITQKHAALVAVVVGEVAEVILNNIHIC
jgi:hypothetical protein